MVGPVYRTFVPRCMQECGYISIGKLFDIINAVIAGIFIRFIRSITIEIIGCKRYIAYCYIVQKFLCLCHKHSVFLYFGNGILENDLQYPLRAVGSRPAYHLIRAIAVNILATTGTGVLHSPIIIVYGTQRIRMLGICNTCHLCRFRYRAGVCQCADISYIILVFCFRFCKVPCGIIAAACCLQILTVHVHFISRIQLVYQTICMSRIKLNPHTLGCLQGLNLFSYSIVIGRIIGSGAIIVICFCSVVCFLQCNDFGGCTLIETGAIIVYKSQILGSLFELGTHCLCLHSREVVGGICCLRTILGGFGAYGNNLHRTVHDCIHHLSRYFK